VRGGIPNHERRRHRRLDLAFPVRFTSRTPSGVGLQGHGLTVDISSGGVRFETDAAEPVPPQAEIAVHITIPRHRESGESAVFVAGRARVVRCQPVELASRHHTGARWCLAACFLAHPEISLPILEDFPLGASGASA